jgi:hypothetical protein
MRGCFIWWWEMESSQSQGDLMEAGPRNRLYCKAKIKDSGIGRMLLLPWGGQSFQIKCTICMSALTETEATSFCIFVISKEGQTSNGLVNWFSLWKGIQRSTPSQAPTEISFRPASLSSSPLPFAFRQVKYPENVVSLRVDAFSPYKRWQAWQLANFFFKDNQPF